MGTPTRPLALALAVGLLATPLAGCVSLTPAFIPADTLNAAGGWKEDPEHTMDEPSGTRFSATRQQALAYKNEGDGDRYPGSLTVITLRSLVTPDEETLVEEVEGLVRESAEARGIDVDGEALRGKRELGNGAATVYFVYNGTVTDSSTLFTQNAATKILGEVTQCKTTRTTVVVVGLAQVTDARTIGGIQFPENRDEVTWRSIVADPNGTIEGKSGRSGLAYNLKCG